MTEADLRYVTLWDLYGGLFTPTQRAICDMYFNYDLSPSEIAEEKKITRQGAQECLKKCMRQLDEYERAVGFSTKREKIISVIDAATKKARELSKVFPEAGEIEKILASAQI